MWETFPQEWMNLRSTAAVAVPTIREEEISEIKRVEHQAYMQ
jgi:hypothetical protein